MKIYVKQTHRHREQTWLPKGERGAGGKDWEAGISIYNLVYMQDGHTAMCNTGNYFQYPVINHNGKEYEESWSFSGGSVLKNLSANTGDTGLIPGPGRAPMPRDN